MKLIFSFLLLALALFQFHNHAHEKEIKKEIIPKSIDFVSTTWLEKFGTFRVIAFNSEDNPCFVVENYKNALAGKLTNASEICKVHLPDHQVFDIKSNKSGDIWFDRFQWHRHFLMFNVNSDQGVYHCKFDVTHWNTLPTCQ